MRGPGKRKRRGLGASQPVLLLLWGADVLTAPWCSPHQADMLQECVKFGTVRRIVTPESPYYDGSVAVVFETFNDAQKCAQTMHGRFFDGQAIEVGCLLA